MGELHPDKYGGPISNDVTTGGRNRNDSIPPESSYIRCKKCGYPFSKVRKPKGWGEGNNQPSTQLNGAVVAGAAAIIVDSTTGFLTPDSGTITAFSNNGSGTKVTSASHGITAEKVTISGTTNYDGTFYVQDKTTNTFVIQKPYVANDATGTWTVPEYIYIYDAGTYSTDEDVSSTFTDATGAPRMNKVSYTGLSSTSFTGCSGALSHDTDMYVVGERVAASGCPFCGTFNYD